MRIYVGNLAYSANEDSLRQAFEQYGQVESATVITDRESGRSKGFGFIEMPNAAEAQQAITALNGQQIAGRAVTVNEARPREDRGGGGGGMGGGGGRDNRSGTGGSRTPRRW
jgi:RNA recognition motif-containing protein